MAEAPIKVKARIIFEMMGNPKEHVEDVLRGFIANIKQDSTLKFSDEFFAEPEEQEKIWSTFAEMTITFPNLEKLTWLCINFTPASIDILEPEDAQVGDKQLTAWYNDLLSRLHEVGIAAKNLSSENDLLKVNINHLIRNFLVAVLKRNEKGLSAEQLGEELGIHDLQTLQPFLDTLVKDGKGRKDHGVYRLL